MINHKDASAVLEVCEKQPICQSCVSEQGRYSLLWTVFQKEPFCSDRIGSFVYQDYARFYMMARTALPYWVQRAIELDSENAKLKTDWQYFRESIAPFIDSEPTDVQDMGYILCQVAAMQEENNNYSGIADELVEADAELAALRADNATLVEALEWISTLSDTVFWKVGWNLDKKTPKSIMNKIADIISSPHPGAALLEELVQLRKDNANYKDMVGLSCEEYRIHREMIVRLEKELEQYKRALKIACEISSDSFRTREEAMEYCLAQAKAGDKNGWEKKPTTPGPGLTVLDQAKAGDK